MQERSDRDQYVELNKFDKLIRTLALSMSATIINSLIITVVLWNVIRHEKLMAWCSINIFYALSRYAIIYYYKKRFNKTHLSAWKIGTFISFAIAGILFGSAGIFLTDTPHFEYVIFLYFVAGGMAVGSVGSYHNNLPIYFVYSSTVFLIPTASIYLIGNAISSPMVVLGIIFYIIVSIMAVRMHRDLQETLFLRYDNIQLVRSLENEKTHTEQLNAELVKINMELKELSLVDPLTSLRNRRYLFDVVMPEIDAFGRKYWLRENGLNRRNMGAKKGYGILLIDLDHFKLINDNYGHDSGDMVLVQVANKLMEKVRHDDIVTRFGGEEFIIILKKIDEISAVNIARILRNNIQTSTYTVTENRTIRLTCSIGFIFYPFGISDDPSITFTQMISLADRAMYYAKDHGRNTSVRAIFLGINSNNESMNADKVNLKVNLENIRMDFEIID
jgi:diguanylate cyclase (GGDEF)-like protein